MFGNSGRTKHFSKIHSFDGLEKTNRAGSFVVLGVETHEKWHHFCDFESISQIGLVQCSFSQGST